MDALVFDFVIGRLQELSEAISGQQISILYEAKSSKPVDPLYTSICWLLSPILIRNLGFCSQVGSKLCKRNASQVFFVRNGALITVFQQQYGA